MSGVVARRLRTRYPATAVPLPLALVHAARAGALARVPAVSLDHHHGRIAAAAARRGNKTSSSGKYLSRRYRERHGSDGVAATAASGGKDAGSEVRAPPTLWNHDGLEDLLRDDRVALALECAGCGIPLQTRDEHGPGYVPAAVFADDDDGISGGGGGGAVGGDGGATWFEQAAAGDNAETEEDDAPPVAPLVVCRRCHALTHHSREHAVALNDAPIKTIPSADSAAVRTALSSIAAKRALVVKVIDMADVFGSQLPDLRDLIGPSNTLMLAGNKVDLLPTGIKHERIKLWLRRAAKAHGAAPIAAVHLVSAASGHGLADLVSEISSLRRDRDVYVVGTTNAGKSTLLNALVKKFGGPRSRIFTTSRLPGTTLRTMALPLDKASFLYDTPGVVNLAQVTWQLRQSELAAVVPSKRIRPLTFFLPAGNTVLLGGLARLDNNDVTGMPAKVTVFVSGRVSIHRCKTDRADELRARHGGGTLLFPPYTAESCAALALVPTNVRIEGETFRRSAADVCVAGLGWFSVAVRGSVGLTVHAPTGVDVGILPAMLPFTGASVEHSKKTKSRLPHRPPVADDGGHEGDDNESDDAGQGRDEAEPVALTPKQLRQLRNKARRAKERQHSDYAPPPPPSAFLT